MKNNPDDAERWYQHLLRVETFMKEVLTDFLSMFYPQTCICCGCALKRNEKYLCMACEVDLPFVPMSVMTSGRPIAERFYGRVEVEGATALLRYEKETISQHVLHYIKYKGGKSFGYRMGRMLGGRLRGTQFQEVDALVPVPLHPNKLKLRGYNQSEWIARGVGDALNIPVWTDVLVRTVENPTQTRKGAYERWENVKGIFQLTDESKIRGRRLLVIDDVMTTGSTVEACILPIETVDGVKVSVATLAVVG